MRSGRTSLERDVVERYELRARDCLVVGTSRQAWRMAITDVEVVYDRALVPLRAWRRITVPGVRRSDGFPEVRRYELRTPEVGVTRRHADGSVDHEVLRGSRPAVVLTTGRGLFTVWLRRARLRPGQSVREWALDLREPLEHLRPVTLHRGQDLYLPWYGRRARVYSIYGRETFFADDTDRVFGDLAGLRPEGLADAPEPPVWPEYGPPDPVHTP